MSAGPAVIIPALLWIGKELISLFSLSVLLEVCQFYWSFQRTRFLPPILFLNSVFSICSKMDTPRDLYSEVNQTKANMT